MTSKYTLWIRIGSAALLIFALFLIVRALPIEEEIEKLTDWVDGLGFWGPLVYGLIYIIAVVLLLPAWILTVGAGAVFGLWLGALTASLAATIGFALCFLIARFFARERVKKIISQRPKLQAIDQAIGEEGWKIVGLLRLSPAVPFNLQNYFYGVTSIRFWPAVITSWIAMLPGTFLYVYIGFIARSGAETTSDSGVSGIGTWVLRIAGLLATIAVIVYVSRIAKRAIGERGFEKDT